MTFGGGDLDSQIAPASGFVSGVVAVGTTQIEAKAGVSRRSDRLWMTIYNDSNAVVYFGPTGVTTNGSTRGEPLQKRQTVTLEVGDFGVFLIAGSAANDVIVREYYL